MMLHSAPSSVPNSGRHHHRPAPRATQGGGGRSGGGDHTGEDSSLLVLLKGDRPACGHLCCACCCWLHRLCHSCRLARDSSEAAAAAAAAAVAMRGALRHKPASLSSLAQRTRFSRQELQLMYRGFKNECPTGVVHRAAFREIFSQFFPLGDASAYADLVFNSFDPLRCGWLTFEIVIQGLSAICKGSTMEKLDWAFRLYDADRDGFINRQEMSQLVAAIYAMLGSSVQPPVSPRDAQLHAERIFTAMDADGDGAVSFQEFVRTCTRGRDLDRELECFDTLLL